MSSGTSGDQISHFGKALTTTASLVFGSQSMEDTILSYSSPYKKILHDTITSSGGTSSLMKVERNGRMFTPFRTRNSAFQDIFHASSGRSYFKNGFSDTRTSFQVLSYLSDAMLADIPSSESAAAAGGKLVTEKGEKGKKKRAETAHSRGPSLYQGFEASLPTINQTITTHQKKQIMNRDIKSIRESGATPDELVQGTDIDKVEDEDAHEEFTLPKGIKPGQLTKSYSIKNLKGAVQLITDNLDLLEIQKNLAASEIRELDLKMEKLKLMRDLVFRRVAKIEQNELFLEKHLMNIRERIDMIEEYNLDNDTDAEKTYEEATSSPEDTKDQYSELPDANTAESGETAVQEPQVNLASAQKSSKKRSKQAGYAHKNHEKKVQQHESRHLRKTYPTLQQYYEPGANIVSFESAHEDNVTCLDFNLPFGTLCSAGKLDPTIKVWNLSKNKHVASITGHLATVSCMQMDQYNTLITGGRDALLKMWDIQKAIDNDSISSDEVCIYTFDSHIDEITALSFEANNLVSGSQDRTIRQWDLNNGKCVQTLDINFATGGNLSRSMIGSGFLNTNNDHPIIGAIQCYDAALATGTKDGIVRLWDLRSGRVVRTLEGHSDAVTSLQFDSLNLVTGSLDNSIRIWDLRTGTLADTFSYEHPVTCLQFDLNKIVVANQEGTVKVYDRQEKKHWFCGGDEHTENAVEYVRYKDGYLVEGRANGDINAWAI
ncbi:AaceriAEL314Wp [[Ashbya] aceris (nom. inval.)]|nr:AaceriAEL314Wp [[Ashbya] aceris (nom. inval.)]